MRVLDSGHHYDLDVLDGDSTVRLVFVKREGTKYPGNTTHYSGTTSQEVLRALIDRTKYVNNQWPCPESESAIGLLEATLVLFELRAARLHGRTLEYSVDDIVNGKTCSKCLHIGCQDEHS